MTISCCFNALSRGFLHLLSLWLTLFDCLKKSLFFPFRRKVKAPFLRGFKMQPFEQWLELTKAVFKDPSLLLHHSFFLTTCLFPLVKEWTGQERREFDCDVFHAAINKSVPAHALWNPEPLYPFHVFPMSQGPDLWPRALDSVISGPRETVWGWSWSGVDYLMTQFPFSASPYPPSSFHRL